MTNDKFCFTCKKTKQITEFAKKRNGKYRDSCIECRKKYTLNQREQIQVKWLYDVLNKTLNKYDI